MKNFFEQNYDITKRRGLITAQTQHVDFYHKAMEEMQEIKAEFTKPDNLEKTLEEVTDLMFVCANWLRKYSDNPEKYIKLVMQKNESRTKYK